ncbi:metallophosphoesterase family protein [Martelella limonii]|uniref:metallophosphoesterase family protein n=1 Tax=Martelella limonii TaxID=1647649 RepID=UPI0015809870|nr:metallophosphoesterase family protein [Martelella limonii]
MKLAAIADIHGNIDALEAVLADIGRHQPDMIVNLGDSLSGPLAGAETADRLLALDLTTVRGNHDRALVDRPFEEMGDWERPVFGALSADHLQWIRDMPTAAVVAHEAYLCHATPKNDEVMWLETLMDNGHFALRSQAEIEAFAAGISYPLILCGHSHVARSVMLGDGRLIVNPGSVGCPGFAYHLPIDHKLEIATPFACYAIIEKTDIGWTPTFHQVRYDTQRMVGMADERGYADWARVLATGRVG